MTQPLDVLVGCECSGAVRDAFRALGHNAWSCDLKDSEGASEWHLRCDVRNLLVADWWDLFIVFPDCQFLCSSGLHWNKRRSGRAEKTEQALAFVRELLDCGIEKIALENSIGRISTAIRAPDQIIQQYHFGTDASKATCLWLKNLPKLKGTKYIPPRLVMYRGKIRQRWANQTDSGQNRLPPSATRAADRARTPPGVAHAMALSWGGRVQ